MADDLRAARADAKAEKARNKAMRPWFKKKRFIIPLVLAPIFRAPSQLEVRRLA